MLSQANRLKVIQTLASEFPNPEPFLTFKSPYELLVAVILSAQCTDVRVNQVTPLLFERANTPEKMTTLSQEELRTLIHSCGYHNQKAKAILAFSRELLERHNGKVPGTTEALTALSGVGRKSAAVVLAQAFGVPAFPVDTHVFRVANRLGLVHEKTPEKTMTALEKTIPREHWIPLHIQLIEHGRKTCKAPKPKCSECALRSICEYPREPTAPTTTQTPPPAYGESPGSRSKPRSNPPYEKK